MGKREKYSFCSIIFIAALIISSCVPRDRYVRISGYAQGGVYSVTFNVKTASKPVRELKNGIDSILTLVDTTLSGYNKASILSRYNRGENPEKNQLFKDVYALGLRLEEETGGALDFKAAPVFALWGFNFDEPSQYPDDALVKAALASCDSTRLNYNAFAQGYTCDLVASYLHKAGVEDMLVDIGEIYCSGLNSRRKAWAIGVDTPFDGNDTPGASLSAYWHSDGAPHGIVTSGNYRKFYTRDGRKYAHTIDPRTGYPVEHNLLSITVIAPDATSADAYATYCMVIGLEETKKFIESRGDLEALAIYNDSEGNMQLWRSKAFGE